MHGIVRARERHRLGAGDRMSLRDAFLSLKPETRLVETRAGTVLVRGMSLALKDRVQGAALRGEPVRSIVLVACVLDPDTDEPVFRAEDVEAVGGLPLDCEELVDVAMELSVLSDADLEELEGNSGGTPSGSEE